jgi:hypothetical protein
MKSSPTIEKAKTALWAQFAVKKGDALKEVN